MLFPFGGANRISYFVKCGMLRMSESICRRFLYALMIRHHLPLRCYQKNSCKKIFALINFYMEYKLNYEAIWQPDARLSNRCILVIANDTLKEFMFYEFLRDYHQIIAIFHGKINFVIIQSSFFKLLSGKWWFIVHMINVEMMVIYNC